MNRRDFVHTSMRASMALPFLRMPAFMKDVRMGIVVHSYASRWNSKVESLRYPGFKNAIDLMEHCHTIGAGGVQVNVHDWAEDFIKRVRDTREKLALFLEGSIGLPKQKADVSRFEKDLRSAKEAGATIVRTVCLSGRRYENFQTLAAFDEFKRNSLLSLQLAEPVMRKHKMKLAVENHKDWRAAELVDILKKIDSEWVGATVDFGNNIALIEDPMEVVRTLAPYVFTTHVKDMGVMEYDHGFLLSEVPLGEGILDLKEMFAVCRKHRADVNFNLEMITRDPLKIPCLTDEFWETLPDVKPAEIAAMLRTVRQRSFKPSLPEVSHLGNDERLSVEEQNIISSLHYGKSNLGIG